VPIWKYKSIEDMPEAWAMNRHVPVGTRIRAMMTLGNYAGPLGIPSGVAKFRSIEELQADRQRYEQERIARLRAARELK
jgi:hypothetical protein